MGIVIEPSQLIEARMLKSDQAKHFGQVYVLRWDGDISQLRFIDNEVAAVQWMSLDEIRSKMFQGEFCNVIDPSVEALIKEA